MVALNWIADHFDLAAFVLILLLILALFIAWRAQGRDDFDFADMLRDSSGKTSVARVGALVCLSISSWYVIYVTIKSNTVSDNVLWSFGLYMGVWSGTKVAERFIDAWLSRGGSVVTQVPTQSSQSQGVADGNPT